MSNITHYNRIPSLLGRGVWDDIFTSFFNEPSTDLVRRSTEGYPVTDIYRDESGNSIIECALAGFTKEDIAIEVKDGRITISANGGTEEATASRRIARRSFTRTYVDHGGKLDLTQTSANFENGLLQVVIPPTPEAQPTMITIS